MTSSSWKKPLPHCLHPFPTITLTTRSLSYEGCFASVIYAYLDSLGLDITAEDVTSKGKIALTVKIADKIYILEFKVDEPGSAMEQLVKKNIRKNIFHNITASLDIFFAKLGFSLIYIMIYLRYRIYESCDFINSSNCKSFVKIRTLASIFAKKTL